MSAFIGRAGVSGSLGLKFTSARRRRFKRRFEERAHVARWKVGKFIRYGWREMPLAVFIGLLPVLRMFVPGLTVVHSRTSLKLIRADGSEVDFGVVGRHLVTTAGKNAIAGAFNNVAPEPEAFKFHGFGTGAVAAVVGDVALGTEGTTAYAVDNTRPTGSQANSTNTYTTVATHTPDAAQAVTEWGLFSQAATGGGTLLDRQTFAAVNLNGTGDSLQATYVLTIS